MITQGYDKPTNEAWDVGQGATICLYTDRYACTIIKRTAQRMTLRRDTATLVNGFRSSAPDKLNFQPGGFSGHTSGEQRYEYAPKEQGETYLACWSKKRARWVTKLGRVISGRHENYDFNF